ncbi:hypothetical protein [Vibrio taketomensis]|uniref:hypothetical protein n=1 Tax=Vibrio taketomensis TaxID=2572923 RepID=UPI00138A2B30|nr:hypothetical protein [Vibrio taketomensis]
MIPSRIKSESIVTFSQKNARLDKRGVLVGEGVALSHVFGRVTFRVVPTENHLPDYVKQAKRDQGDYDGKAHAVIGKIRFYLVAEHLDTQSKVEETLFHEV